MALLNEQESDASLEALRMIEYLTQNVADVQSQVLSTILETNSGTEYLQRFGLIDNPTSFFNSIPIANYEDLQPEIRRIANGDKSPILCACPTTEFLTSSGTSAGERKLMPSTTEELERKKLFYSLLMPVINKYVPGLDKGKALYFLFVKSETITPGGIPARPVLTSYYKSPQFTERDFDPFNNHTSPNEAILCPDTYQSMYCQMLCGLVQRRQVLRIGAVFASALLRAMRFLEEHWTQLCRDISTGELSSTIVDPSLRVAILEQILVHPDPQLAEDIVTACSSGEKASWEGIITILWPNTKYLEAIVTGTMSQYIQKLNYYSGGLPILSTMYASSECYLGLNLNPICKPSQVAYTIIPNMGYFEFLPVQQSNNNQNDTSALQLVPLADVEDGKEYELIVTTFCGLYRYRIGDVLRVKGFYNSAPQFQFVCRKNTMLSVESDKTDEDCLHQAVTEAAVRLELESHATLFDYTSFADSSTIPGHYVLFWEIRTKSSSSSDNNNTNTNNNNNNNNNDPPLRTDTVASLDCDDHAATADRCALKLGPVVCECCLDIEQRLDSVYRQCRSCDKSIGALEIRIVQPNTFDELMDFCVSRGASINQYKTPRCIESHSPALQLLNSRVVCSFFSPRPPSWSPARKW